MAYTDQTALETAIGPQAVAILYDDGLGAVDTSALTTNANRASAWVDSFLSFNYRGPFPVTQDPAPMMMAEAALYYLIAFSYDRRPEFARTEGEGARPNYIKRAEELLTRLVRGMQQMPDYTAQPKPGNVGGIVYASGPRMVIDSTDGTNNGGDF